MSTAAETPSNLPAAAGGGGADQSLGSYVRGWWDSIRAGDLGIFPILVGIVVIGAYFQYRNSNFLSAGNFVNLIVQMSPFAIIGMGLVFVLLLGEIDLSVGFVSGMGGVIAAVLLEPDGNQTSTVVAVAAALAVGCVIGLLQGFFVATLGVPSFVVTLAGLLGWNGVVLLIIGDRGTIVIQDKFINGLANDTMSEGLSWVVALGSVALYLGIQLATIYRRRKFELPNPPWSIIALKTVVIAALAIGVTAWAHTDRGVPFVGLLMLGLLLFWTYIAIRTRFGRHVYSVGGNAEASRRAGISLAGIRLAVFAISGTMAAVGGLVLASRLSSVDTSTGSGSVLLYSIAAAVIGGTSLFGGRGTVRSAVLGAVVIAMIENGLGLINVSAGTKFIVTGIVLLAAVTLDSLSRRRIVATGRA